jgi:CO/xanthine dehydrogenase Mo-binding subunit
MGCAIAAALRPLGARINEMPFSPPRIWAEIEKTREAKPNSGERT